MDKLWKSKNHLRNQTENFWKSKYHFRNQTDKIWKSKNRLSNQKDKQRIKTNDYFSDTPRTPYSRVFQLLPLLTTGVFHIQTNDYLCYSERPFSIPQDSDVIIAIPRNTDKLFR